MTADDRKTTERSPLGSFRLRGREVSRLEAFSDAVFGFSATLLVVSLEVPQTFAELVDSLWGFVAFAFSFGALVLIWTAHNGFFRRYGLRDGMTVFLNSILLFVVLFYVYPLKFVASGIVSEVLEIRPSDFKLDSPEQLGSLFAIYGIGFVAVFTCFSLLYLHAFRRAGELSLEPREKLDARILAEYYSVYAIVGCLSVVLALLGVGLRYAVPGWIYFLIGPLAFAHDVWATRRRTRLERSGG